MNRKALFVYGGLLVVGGGAAAYAMRTAPAAAEGVHVTVYKSPTCGCCRDWVEHMREAGFDVTVQDVADMDAIKQQHGVPGPLQSCHTAIVDGLVIEGHVPADLVERLLAERPADAWGLAVPGMPAGSPGMEQDGRQEPYDVILYNLRTRGATIYATR